MADAPDLDEVLAPSFVDGLSDRGTDDLRRLRRSCEAVEEQLSYRRRLLHGHMDLLRAELERRGLEDATGAVTELLGHLSDGPGPGTRSPSHQRIAMGAADEAGQDAYSADLPDRSDEELRARGEELVAKEQELSDLRRTVLSRLDAIQAEVLRRYRDGSASIDEILPPASA